MNLNLIYKPFKGADLVRILKKIDFFAFSESRIFQKYFLKIPDKSDLTLNEAVSNP